MFNFFVSFFIVIMTCHLGQVKAVDYECKKEDLELSKSSFIISGYAYKELKQNEDGVITLCFNSDNHPALVFECFSPKNPNEIYLSMVSYRQSADLCGSKVVHVDSQMKTLLNIRGGVNNSSDGVKEELTAYYKKYASWILPNKDLLDGLREAEKEAGKTSKYSQDEFEYICSIINISGVRNTNFGFFDGRNSENMKRLVNSHMIPKPKIH